MDVSIDDLIFYIEASSALDTIHTIRQYLKFDLVVSLVRSQPLTDISARMATRPDEYRQHEAK